MTSWSMWRKNKEQRLPWFRTCARLVASLTLFLATLVGVTNPVQAAVLPTCSQISVQLKEIGQHAGVAKIFAPYLIIPQSFAEANPDLEFAVIYDTPVDAFQSHEFGKLTGAQDFPLINSQQIIDYLQSRSLTDIESPQYTEASLEFFTGLQSLNGTETPCDVNVTYSPSQLFVWHNQIDTGEVPDPEEQKKQEEEEAKLAAFSFCNQVPGDTEDPATDRGRCVACLRSGQSDEEGSNVSGTIYTALGCIRTDQQGLLRDIVKLLLGVGGMAALLAILAGSFQYTTSRGDTNKVKEAKELITAAVVGLFFMIFSIIILDFVGVQLFRIPGLSSAPTEQGPGDNDEPPVCAVSGVAPAPNSPCCDGLITDAGRCAVPRFTVDNYLLSTSDGPAVCVATMQEGALASISNFSGSISCSPNTGAITCHNSLNQTFGALNSQTEIPEFTPGYTRYQRCTGPVNYNAAIETTVRGFLDSHLPPNSYSLEITGPGGDYYHADYLVSVRIDPDAFNQLFPDIQQQLQATNTLSVATNAELDLIVAGETVHVSTNDLGGIRVQVRVESLEGAG